MKAPLSPCAPTLQSHSLQPLPKKTRTDLLEPSSDSGSGSRSGSGSASASGSGSGSGSGTGTGTTGKGVENPETRSSSLGFLVDMTPAETGSCTYYDIDIPGFKVDKAENQRHRRANDARIFRYGYRFGSSHSDPEIYEKKYCIWSSHTCSWEDKSSGIMWVAVHGIDSICVVTVNGVDMTRIVDNQKLETENEILYDFLMTVISDIEDIADPHSKIRKRLGHMSIKKPPFSVVSVIPLANGADLESDQDEVDEDIGLEDSVNCSPNKAVEFLRKKMKSGDSTSTTSKTIETAVGALQQLCLSQLEACEIQGCFLDFKEMKVEYLWNSRLEKHLAVINAEASIN